MTRWLETDSLSNQDISSALAIGAYTADADRLVLVQFFADQVAGNGDYTFYVTQQVGGSGSSYRYIPITTAAAASGVTAIGGQSGMIAVRSGDVLTVYLDGLAGDTTTPDTTVRWFELDAAPSAEDVAGAVRTELATELAHLDEDVSSRLADEDYTAPPSAADIATAVVQKPYNDYAEGSFGNVNEWVPSAATIAAAVDATLTAAHDEGSWAGLTAQEARDALKLAPSAGDPAAGSIDAELDAIRLITDALDTSAVTVTTSNDAGLLTIYRGVTFTATVSGLTISASWTKVYLTIKTDLDLADSAATVQVVETNPGAGTDGLLYLNGAAPVSPITNADAALVVTQGAGTVAITLSDNMTALLSRGKHLHWDLKQIVSGATSGLLASGTADIELTPTRTI